MKLINMDKNYVTPEAFKSLKEELHELKTKKRKEIAEKLQETKELGDLAENAAYEEAKNSQEVLESRILELEILLRNVSIIRPSPFNNHKVVIGSKIETESVNKPKTKKTFTIVGSQEANPSEGRVSNESPFGKAFLGHKKGEIVFVKTPQGMVKYKIIKIL